MIPSLRAGLAALAAAGGLAAAAHAQQPPLDPVPVVQPDPVPPLAPCPPRPRVIEWPGGSVVLGPEVVVRQPGLPGRSTTVITGTGNGFGNSIVIDNGGLGGVTVVRNARNGVGNRLVLDPADQLLDLDLLGFDLFGAAPARVGPAPAYRGKANAFWTHKQWSDAHDCNLYWSPADKAWYRYHADDDAYRPLPARPAPLP